MRLATLAAATSAALVATTLWGSPQQVHLAADATALIMGTSGVPTPNGYYVDHVMDQFIDPTHPGTNSVAKVPTPEGLWPLGGVGRVLSLLGFGGDPKIFGPGGPAWDVPWWQLHGLFDPTLDQSVRIGVGNLEGAVADELAENPDRSVVIFGYSQSAVIANRVKRGLAAQYPDDPPDIDFVLYGDPNLPNGGFFARVPGLYIPILDWTANGAAPTDTGFDTVEIVRQYDLFADFPLYPLNLVAVLNAVLGFTYVHLVPFDVSLEPDSSTPPPIKTEHGDTTYYFFETPDLPLFGPLRMVGVPEPVIDVFEPFFREVVELGYDRSIPLWKPTPARLIPRLDPAEDATKLVNAVGEGIENAAALVSPPPNPPAPVTLAADEPEERAANIEQPVGNRSTATASDPVAERPTRLARPERPLVRNFLRAQPGKPLAQNTSQIRRSDKDAVEVTADIVKPTGTADDSFNTGDAGQDASKDASRADSPSEANG